MIQQATAAGATSKASASSPLDVTIAQIKKDAWNGKGPREYTLPNVRSLYVAGDSNRQTLYANAKPVAYLSGNAADAARAAELLLKDIGNAPSSINLQGSYGNTVFYIDSLSVEGY